MSTTIHLPANTLVPTSQVELNRDKTGLWTCNHTLQCRYTDHANEPVKSKLRQGTPITDIDPNIPIFYDFITLEGHRVTHERGGITKIFCRFSGASADDGFSGVEGPSVSYSFRGNTGKASILEHPNYLHEVSNGNDRDAIAGYYNGEAYLDKDGATYYIRRKLDDDEYGAGAITDATTKKWIDYIARGIRTYDKQQIDWTVIESNKLGMTQSELDDFGRKVDTVPGSPPEPNWASANAWWFFSSITEDKDPNSSSYSRTFTLREDELIADIYDYTIS